MMDKSKMELLNKNSDLLEIEFFGEIPEKYRVTYKCKGLVWIEGNSAPSSTTHHQMEIYLHQNYPRVPPRLTWLTQIFHPNILSADRNGGVCIGSWTPAESLDRLCVRIGEMIQYKNYNLSDPLDTVAAEWARKNTGKFPIDNRNIEKSPDKIEINTENINIS